MNVLQITTSSSGGAGIAALRLQQSLQNAGVNSGYLSMDKTIGFDNVVQTDNFFKYRKPTLLDRLKGKLKPESDIEANEIKSTLKKIRPQLSYEMLSLPFSNYQLEDHPLVRAADVIHFHWMGKILDYHRFFSQLNKPLVWTLHDMNPFMGMYHYAKDQHRNEVSKTLDSEIVELKRKALLQVNRAAVVSPSKWLLDEAIASGMFGHFRIKQVIANGIDVELFGAPKSPSLRDQLGIGKTERVLLFVSDTLDNPRKGMDLLQEALSHLTHSVTVLTLGKGEFVQSNSNVKIIPLGYRRNEDEIAACYQAADAFVLPSREDNLPNTMLEALSAGTPVISFNVGGMKSHLKEDENGLLADEISGKALAHAIEKFFEKRENFDADRIRKYAATHFSMEQLATSYTRVYQQLMSD